jgi:hypothetical protein
MQKVGNHTIVGASGDLSDYQKIMKMAQEMQTYDMAHDDGCSMSPKDFHQYMGRVMYNRSVPCSRTPQTGSNQPLALHLPAVALGFVVGGSRASLLL